MPSPRTDEQRAKRRAYKKAYRATPAGRAARNAEESRRVRRRRVDSPAWAARNKERQTIRMDGRLEAHRLLTDRLKSAPCADCGFSYPPICMDFDHLPGCGKTMNVSAMMKYPTSSLMKEIAKCEVVCSNCHRLRTAQRQRESQCLKSTQSSLPA